jgi:hypothetical protein
MNSHFDKDAKGDVKRPTCLILDEIDGALGGDGQSRGLKMVADYLNKAISVAETRIKQTVYEYEGGVKGRKKEEI